MSDRTLHRRLVDWLIDARRPILTFGILLAVLAWFPAHRLDFDRSIENMFSSGDELVQAYDRLQAIFGDDEIVLLAYVDPQLLTDGGLARLAELSRRAGDVPGVSSSRSLATLPAAMRDALGDSLHELFEGFLIGADRETAAIVCTLAELSEAGVPRHETIARLRELARQHDSSGVVAGAPIMVVDGFRYIEIDGRLLGWASTLLLMGTIAICFRSLRWVVLPIIIVNVTLLFTQATLVLLRWEPSMVSSMLWAIVTVIGIATVIHIIVRFREARDAGETPEEALRTALDDLWTPIVWTCLTDAAGFGALLFAEVGPVRDFGRMMAIGALLALVSIMLFVPGLALGLNRYDADPRRAWGEGRLSRLLQQVVATVRRRPKSIGLSILLVTVIAAVGIPRLQIESDFTSNFRRSTDIVKSYDFVESRLGGAGVWDIIAPVPSELAGETAEAHPNGQQWQEFLAAVRELEDRLREIEIYDADLGRRKPGLTKVLSLVDIYDVVPDERRQQLLAQYRQAASAFGAIKGFFGGDEAASTVPQHPFAATVEALQSFMPGLIRTFWAQDPTSGRAYLRIMLRAEERQPSDQKKALIAAVQDELALYRREFGEPEIDPLPAELRPQQDSPVMVAHVQAQVTGFFVLLTNLIDSLLADQWVTFGMATLAIGLMLWMAFRSLTLAVVALVPNALPIVVITGCMGWLGVKLNMGAVMIAAVSMGLAVDSSIHYITAFRRQRLAGRTVYEALEASHQTVGRAMTFATLALIVGFASLALSNFVPTVYFGVLVSVSMFGGLLGNLILLPLLLTLISRQAA